jgi:Tol biopolymer transport system component
MSPKKSLSVGSRLLTLFAAILLSSSAACGQATARPTVIPLPTATVWPPAGSIAFSKPEEGNKDVIYLIHPDGAGLTELTDGPDPWNEHPSWFPDGSRIVYHSGRFDVVTYTLWTIHADGSGRVQLTTLPPGSLWPAVSPDGTRIAFSAITSLADTHHIKLMNVDGDDQRMVTNGPANDLFPSWGPNGTILFLRKDNLEQIAGDIFSVRPDGTGLTQLTKAGNVDGYALSPDGKKIAFFDKALIKILVTSAEASGASETLIDTGSFVTVGFARCVYMALAWSADGQALALACSDFGTTYGSDLYIVKADGSGLTKIPNTEGGFDPAWRP